MSVQRLELRSQGRWVELHKQLHDAVAFIIATVAVAHVAIRPWTYPLTRWRSEVLFLRNSCKPQAAIRSPCDSSSAAWLNWYIVCVFVSIRHRSSAIILAFMTVVCRRGRQVGAVDYVHRRLGLIISRPHQDVQED